MPKEKEFNTMEAEVHELAVTRAKQLEPMGRKDRDKMSKINSQFNVDRSEIQAKWKKKQSDADEKAQKKAGEKKERDQKTADKKAENKQDKK